MSGLSRLIWGVAVNSLFLFVSIITILAAAEEIIAGKYVTFYAAAIFAWAPVCALFIALTIDFFHWGNFASEQ